MNLLTLSFLISHNQLQNFSNFSYFQTCGDLKSEWTLLKRDNFICRLKESKGQYCVSLFTFQDNWGHFRTICSFCSQTRRSLDKEFMYDQSGVGGIVRLHGGSVCICLDLFCKSELFGIRCRNRLTFECFLLNRGRC